MIGYGQLEQEADRSRMDKISSLLDELYEESPEQHERVRTRFQERDQWRRNDFELLLIGNNREVFWQRAVRVIYEWT